jgi:hypothetical protein
MDRIDLSRIPPVERELLRVLLERHAQGILRDLKVLKGNASDPAESALAALFGDKPEQSKALAEAALGLTHNLQVRMGFEVTR